jgi:hypothetical protein
MSAWSGVVEQLLDGVTHQLSNRVALLSGISQILEGDETVPPILRALADEVPKLEETLRLLRLLGPSTDEREEASEVGPLLRDAAALAALHPALRDVAIPVPDTSGVPPVVVRPLGVTRAVVSAMVHGAIANDPPLPVDVVVTHEDAWVRIGVGAQPPVVLPTLLAARRTEQDR